MKINMEFNIDESMPVLQNTPEVLSMLFSGLDEDWFNCNEGINSWTPKEVLAHLIVVEDTDWIPRVKVILFNDNDGQFKPIDMQAHFYIANNNSIQQLLQSFRDKRKASLAELNSCNISENDLSKCGLHPKLGSITLQQLLATWVTHDLTHLAQISRVMSKKQKNAIGPFIEFFNTLKLT